MKVTQTNSVAAGLYRDRDEARLLECKKDDHKKDDHSVIAKPLVIRIRSELAA